MNHQNSDNGEATPASQSHGSVVRPTLPDRRVNASTIEDAYVSFIFYCNPALPLSSDTESLREAFRTPPKSGGKAFDTFTIYELVQKLYQKEIKTWTELSTTLGVEPPDPSKDESAQKVAQYGVRLKKWMNSMHVKAFFEYLMSIPNDYWTKIPDEPNPVAIAVRDGVAIEDDMALRALLPYIRPKRGRKRPEGDDAIASPVQRPRLSPPLMVADGYRQELSEPWSAHPDARSGMSLDPSRTQHPTAWATNESLQTPVSRWPHSAVTPTTRASFWHDALEPRSALTPGKGKMAGHRRGAKNVSSAWKTASQDPGTRPRGRPPINRTSMDRSAHYDPQACPPTHAASETLQFQRQPAPAPAPAPQLPQILADHRHPYPAADDHHLDSQGKSSYNGARPARPSISLQVPERRGSAVRLATPPALVPPPTSTPSKEEAQASRVDTTRSEQFKEDDDKYQDRWQRFAKEATDAYEQNAAPRARAKETGLASDGELEDYYFDKMENRTNVDVLVAYFTRSMTEADWRDQHGNITPPVDLEQSTAMVHAMLQTMYKTATSPQAFLINLAALAGSTTLVRTRPKCTRLSEKDGQFIYKCEWDYQFGDVKGGFTFEQVVPATMWAKAKKKSQQPPPPDPSAAEGANGGSNDDDDDDDDKGQLFSKAYWQRKYEELTIEMMNRDKDLADLKDKVMAALGREFLR
ncbi:hypothetical protein E4U43_001951 [Claviceps pusilla]|uniref:Ars binding protein 2 n=1 Tax=Claviceps pusilla TaxID=123648 RepID=A0A9P7NIF8_9HYPO|nr:hypothetical protein E4U43_001951 [Claviceps pusilla]